MLYFSLLCRVSNENNEGVLRRWWRWFCLFFFVLLSMFSVHGIKSGLCVAMFVLYRMSNVRKRNCERKIYVGVCLFYWYTDWFPCGHSSLSLPFSFSCVCCFLVCEVCGLCGKCSNRCSVMFVCFFSSSFSYFFCNFLCTPSMDYVISDVDRCGVTCSKERVPDKKLSEQEEGCWFDRRLWCNEMMESDLMNV